MEIAIKAAVAGICGSVAALVIKRYTPSIALMVGAAVSLVTAALAMGVAGELKRMTDNAASLSELSPAVTQPVLKCIGIGAVTRFGADMCKDAGQASAASAVELAGAAAALMCALPLISTLLDTVGALI